MKKLCLILLFTTLFLISGCKKDYSEQTHQANPPSTFSANLDIKFRESEMKARLTKHSTQKYEIQMLSPEIMTPLLLTYENGICTVRYDGLTFETDMKRFPQAEFGALITHALSDIDSGTALKSSTENGIITYKGITDYGDFNLTQDISDGMWKEFSVNGLPLKVIFSEYKTN